MLGYEVAQSTVLRYMARGGRPPSQGWKTFLRNHAHAIAAIDLCIVPIAGRRGFLQLAPPLRNTMFRPYCSREEWAEDVFGAPLAPGLDWSDYDHLGDTVISRRRCWLARPGRTPHLRLLDVGEAEQPGRRARSLRL